VSIYTMRLKRVFIITFAIFMIVSLLLVLDLDGDGLLTYHELFQTKTNPFQKDTDKDGLSDGQEMKWHTNPLVADTDGDGILDGDEVYKYQTNPLLVDTDGDGFSDLEPFPSDPSRPALSIEVNDIGILKKDWRPFLRVSYNILADQMPLNTYWISNSSKIQDRLDWSNLSIAINGVAAQVERNQYLQYFSCPVELQPEINVTVRYRTSVLNKQFTAAHITYAMGEINTDVDRISVPKDPEMAFDTIQKAVDNYATVISGFIFMQDHLSKLKEKITSAENWGKWLVFAMRNANSVTDAISNFENYANASGVSDLINNVWIELQALAATSNEFTTILTQHPDAVKEALLKLAQRGLGDPTQLLGILNTISSATDGETLYQAIQSTIVAMQFVYAQLAVEFFDWIANTTRTEVTRSNPARWQIAYYANGSSWYMDHLSDVRSWTSYWHLGSWTLPQSNNPFPSIIEVNMEWTDVGERGVAWWPADYYAMFIPPDYYGYIENTPFQSDSRGSASAFPRTEVKISGGELAGTYLVFLATESIVRGYLKQNGFHAQCLPPTTDQKEEFFRFWAVAQYVAAEAGSVSNVFVYNETVFYEVRMLSIVFTNFESIYSSIASVQKYVAAATFLEEINRNLWQVNS